ncbi:hypothetical protein J6590_063184 [Homalodisca vitripennis]|nr:hypothetical protein J6590_063184 [Homalodisca vitripennis]
MTNSLSDWPDKVSCIRYFFNETSDSYLTWARKGPASTWPSSATTRPSIRWTASTTRIWPGFCTRTRSGHGQHDACLPDYTSIIFVGLH